MIRTDALRMKRAWRCPDAGFEPLGENTMFPTAPLSQDPGDVKDHADALESIKQVQRLTGVKCATCPNWYTARPWVLRAATYEAFIRDQAAALVADHMDGPTFEAVLLIRASRAAEHEETERQRENK